MNMMNRFSILLLALVLSSCQTVQPYDEQSRHYQVPENSILVLNTQVSIAPGLARAYFQYGRPVEKKVIDKYQPHCYLLLRTLSEQAQTVQPDSFSIHRVERDFIVSMDQLRYASLDMSMNDPSLVEYVNIYHLSSPRQPQVMSLNCLQWALARDRFYPSVAEVRQALGKLFSLQLSGVE